MVRYLRRSDIERFAFSAELVENFSLRTQGPLVRRRGSTLTTSPVAPTDRLVTYAPTRSGAEVLLFLNNGIRVLTSPIADYSNPATAPTLQYNDEALRVRAKYGVCPSAANTVDKYFLRADVSGSAVIAPDPVNTWSGYLGFSRGLFSNTPSGLFYKVTVDGNELWTNPTDLLTNANIPVFDAAFGYVTQAATNSYATAQLTRTIAAGSVVFDLVDEYTQEQLIIDATSAPTTGSAPTPWTGSGTSVAYSWVSGSPGQVTIRLSSFRFAFPITFVGPTMVTEMVAGANYRINYNRVFTPTVGSPVSTPEAYSFTWNGSDLFTPTFSLPHNNQTGTTTISGITWD